MGLSLAGPSNFGLGLCALWWFARVDPVTDASAFPYRPSFDRGLGRCTAAVSCGRRQLPWRVGGCHARVPCVSACARSSWPGRAGRPPGRVLVRVTFPLAALSFCFAQPPPGRACPFLLVCFPFFGFFCCSSLCLRAPVVSGFLWFPAPGVLGLGAGCLLRLPPPPPTPLVFYVPSWFSVLPAWVGVCFQPPSFSSTPPPVFFYLPLLPPLPRCVRPALCRLVSPRCAAVPSGVLRCRVAVLCAACRAVVSRLAWLWAAVAFCVYCCVVPCCWLLLVCWVASLVVSSRCVAGVVACGLVVAALPCAVPCPWVLCCAVMLRVAPPYIVLLCAVSCCLALFAAAARCVVPLGAVRCPGVLCLPALCAVLSPRTVCSVLCVFWRGLLVRAVVQCLGASSSQSPITFTDFGEMSELWSQYIYHQVP